MILGFNIFILMGPTYYRRLVYGSSWPIVLVFVATVMFVAWEGARGRSKKSGAKDAPDSSRSIAVQKGLERALVPTLLITFVLVPSTATRIFKTFLCDPFEYSEHDTRRYLQDDLDLSCGSEEYGSVRNAAIFLVLVWPVGVPLLYAVLLWMSRDALGTGEPTALSRATAFLSGDYTNSAYWWEPLEMCRKLTLTGWVLLVREEADQARALVALLVSVSFLALHLSIKPLKRCATVANA